ncbi:condensation domain-containing protein [Microbulbifer sp. THAF38]|uniref:condensation domain-containing protein n=1 Tax=Microbulbifer sp. THAF38 TaxID=2587856 RepID=UPI00126916D4|nr:condensation domain-containing protein [Microbulbifer sp. THAF38]QFT54548.1 Linear gramicidin synthase subunit B [Microbulbifer sp. THAF38]
MPGWDCSTHVPLSITEQSIYNLNHRKVLADLITRAMRIKGDVDVELFERAIPLVVNSYPIFRCRYHDEPAVRSFDDIELDYMDIRHMSEAHITSFLRQFSSSPMDLISDQLLGLSLFRTGEDEYIFLIKCHHIITDGISLSLLWAESLTAYLTMEAGKPYRPRGEATDFADYINFEDTYLESERGQKARYYWRNKLELQHEAVWQASHQEIVSIICKEATLNIEGREFEEIQANAGDAKVSLFAYLCAAYQQTLCEFLHHDFWLNTSLSLRLKLEHRYILGPMFRYGNLSVCRNESWPEKLTRLSQEIKRAVRTAYAADSIGPHGSIGHNLNASSCFLVSFLQTEEHHEGFSAVYTGETSDWVEVGEKLKIHTTPLPTRLTPYGIYLSIAAYGGQLRASFIYNVNCFSLKQVECIMDRWRLRAIHGSQEKMPPL